MHKILGILLFFISPILLASNTLQDLVNSHRQQYGSLENFSAIQVSIKAGGDYQHYVSGTRTMDPGSPLITRTDLFNIGSITKSFTAALSLLAEAEGKIQLNKPISNYLAQYPYWGTLTLTGLLNMSTGIPNYSDSPTMNYLISKNLQQCWRPARLIDLVYPKLSNPPRRPGYFYSNTGYALIDLILSKQYQMPFKKLLQDKLLQPLGLKNTFYPVPEYSKDVLARLVHGYSYNIYDNPELLGQDVTQNNLSWAGAAGALVANSEDVVYWLEQLFIDEKLLTAFQKKTMQQLISVATGKPLPQTDKDNPRGFGLGITQGYDDTIGHYWFYEGQTLGYRALYIYVPCNQVIITSFFNSATNSENDHSSKLLLALYHETLKEKPDLACK